MKKYLWLLILLCPFLVSAAIQPQHLRIISQYNAGGADACSPRGTAALYWDGEWAADRDNACVAAGQRNGTATAGVINQDIGDHTTGTGWVADLDATDEQIIWTESGEDIFNIEEGSLVVWVYVETEPTDYNCVFSADAGDSANRLWFCVRGSNDLYARWETDDGVTSLLGNECTLDPAYDVTLDTWQKWELEWTVAGSEIRLDLDDAGWCTCTDATSCTDASKVTAVTPDPEIGGYTITNAPLYVDDLWIWTSYGQT